MPTDEYLGDMASINYITKEYKTGGYISFDGEQTIGYLNGDYNIGSKIAHGNTNYLLFAGHNMKKYDGTNTEKEENFALDVLSAELPLPKMLPIKTTSSMYNSR